MIKHLSVLRAGAIAAALLAGTAFSASAASITFDFTTASNSTGSIGNTRTYSSGGVTLTVSAVSTTGNNGALANAALGTYNGAGLGVCNANEINGCDSPEHQIDNVGAQDFVVFRFSVPVDVTSVVIDPFSCDKNHCTPDRDARYFIGSAVLNNIAGMSPNQLVSVGGLTEYVDTASSSFSSRIVTVGGAQDARTLVFGAPSTDLYDWFKIASMTVNYTPSTGGAGDPVPAPATFALFGAALAGLGIARRRRA